MLWTRSHLGWLVIIVLVTALTAALLQGATPPPAPGATPLAASPSSPATSIPAVGGSPPPSPVSEPRSLDAGIRVTIARVDSVRLPGYDAPTSTPHALPASRFTARDWARPFDIEGVRLGMARNEAWKFMGERTRWRRSTDGPLEIWTSLDLPARRVVYSGDGRVEALSGLSLGHQGRVIFSDSVQEAQAYLGPPDLKGNALMDETWIWNRHGSTGFIGLHVKSGRVVISRSEDRVL